MRLPGKIAMAKRDRSTQESPGFATSGRRIGQSGSESGTLTMSTISTHILDTSRGRPAAGVSVKLEILSAGEGWSPLSEAVTDNDGRVKEFILSEQLGPGTHRLLFSVGKYFESLNQESFYPEVTVTFLIGSATEHYHVPLLISPFGYSTYRGS